jgi:hypothetical protein
MNPFANPSIADRRERLLLQCQLDRLKLRTAVRKASIDRVSLSAADLLVKWAPHLPGRAGKWAKEIIQGLLLFRGLYDSLIA